MALSNYTDLKAAIDAWTARDDVASRAADFIALGEDRIQRDLAEIEPLKYTSSIATVAGQRTIDMPADLMDLKYVYMTATAGPLNIKSAAELNAHNQSVEGTPSYLAIEGRKFIFYPVPDAVYTVNFTGTRRIPPLSDNVSTNWLLDQSKGIYLYAALCEALNFIDDQTKADRWSAAYESAREGLAKINWEGTIKLTVDPALQARGAAYDIRTDG